MSDSEGDTSTVDLNTDSRGNTSQDIDIQFATSTGGLDFISSSHPNIEFGYDDSDVEEGNETEEDDDDDDDEDDSDTGSIASDSIHSPTRVRTNQRQFKTIMYISMEYCEKRVSYYALPSGSVSI